MAPEAPDPQSLKSWQDAFQYPIPTVRRVEQELRRDIASNKEKLRALVGTRYRELVGTAETIVVMNKEIQNVDSILSDVGRRCNPRLVEKKHLHARQMKRDMVEKDADKHTFGAQLALLHRCTTSIARLLRRRASLLLIAKILVVSRLLHKTLSQQESIPPFLDDLRKQLASLRLTLLNRIDKRLASSNATEETIIESLAAYCLVSSTSSDEAIHKFHQVRLGVITSQLEKSRENIPKTLRILVATLQTSKVLRSRQFTDVLSKLKSRPVLSDPEIRNLDGLEIEILGRFAAPGVINFTPYIKLSDLSRSEGVDSIKEWSLTAFEKFAEGCLKSLAHSNDFQELLSLRTETFELWLESWGSTIMHRSVNVLERLRGVFNDNLKRVLTTKVETIDELSGHISTTISSWQNSQHHNSNGSLWDSDMISADYSNGAATFKQSVTDRLLGRDADVSAVLVKYQSWLASIRDVNQSIDTLRRLRWTDVLVGSEVEDDDINITPQLNEEDPRLLSDSLQAAMREAFNTLQVSFSEAFNAFGSSHQSEKATFLLRLIRLVRRDIPTGFVADDFLFSSDVVPGLQKLLAAEIVAQTGSLSFVPSSNTHPETKKLKIVPGRSLWEGEPPVPVQPSPGAFKYLRRLAAIMDENGSDLWDPSTLRVLKEALQTQLETLIGSTLDELDNWKSPIKPSESSETKDEDPQKDEKEDNKKDASDDSSRSDTIRDWKIQLFFDAVYLAHMLGDPAQLADVAGRVQKSADANPEMLKSMQKMGQEYWKRTELLFGLLAER
ncbi:hypothetical protein N7509_013358 [Penicillium cosmopolitanum]|uniref:Conserved oligomeric Golgi complex subunit 1 n=1 Tax=Penicillium cosmopolitanum TaxID=1131564 RepID=A0A9W9SE45_9EURO|nr:uncharacterized protein N7509_013358 [Penicillium cosmopolitanum]KAJ5376472.1 hypothetical protein N7509_013358 [Penicillium cosmopolitanum]